MEKKREIDPVIRAAAKSYEASLSESTPMTHYLVVWHDAGRTRISAEWTKKTRSGVCLSGRWRVLLGKAYRRSKRCKGQTC